MQRVFLVKGLAEQNLTLIHSSSSWLSRPVCKVHHLGLQLMAKNPVHKLPHTHFFLNNLAHDSFLHLTIKYSTFFLS